MKSNTPDEEQKVKKKQKPLSKSSIPLMKSNTDFSPYYRQRFAREPDHKQIY
jgi:hypothetical protein